MAVIDISAEVRMNQLTQFLGLDYRVEWTPDPEAAHDAMTFPEKKLIQIYATTESEARDALIHEVLELRLNPTISLHVGIENTLLTLLQQVAHAKKEEAINQVVKDMRLINQFEEAEKR